MATHAPKLSSAIITFPLPSSSSLSSSSSSSSTLGSSSSSTPSSWVSSSSSFFSFFFSIVLSFSSSTSSSSAFSSPSSSSSSSTSSSSSSSSFSFSFSFPLVSTMIPAGSERFVFFGCYLALGAVLAVTNFFILPVLLQMLLYTFPIIYVGSHLSLKQAEVDEVTGEKVNKGEAMSRTDAMLFPVFGSAALLTLYVAYRYLDPWWVNCLITTYLTGIGCMALAETISIGFLPLASPALRDDSRFSFRLAFWPFGTAAEPTVVGLSWVHVASYAFAIAASALWLYTKNWILHNLFAIAFCIQAISLVSVGSFPVAALLLVGLFLYDIFWVFGTEVMVTVAKAFEGPAKLIFPMQFDPWQQSILGLGDVVIPGIFISMCLRFDNWMHEERENLAAGKKDDGAASAPPVEGEAAARANGPTNVDIHATFGKFYFYVVLISYELGLLTTGMVMIFFRRAQPALLYLVPFCLLALFGAAALNGQMKDVMAYKEDEEEAAALAAAEAAKETSKETSKESPEETSKEMPKEAPKAAVARKGKAQAGAEES
eukprot:GHVT01060432.1.p1 GENE.GHVT01060432.1~~GHVT01060432.1.p1  ORF type:complete len:543 (-),score=191.14 GHVT01060432.1:1475-3103(-)